MPAPWKKSYDKSKQHIKKQRHFFADKDPRDQSYGFSSSHVWMWELDYKKSWVLKNWCFWTVVLESPLDSKKIQLVHPKGNQSWIFIGKTDPEAEAPIFWPPDVKIWLIWKDPDAGKDWRQEVKGTEDKMVGWHRWLDGHEFEQTPGVGDGHGSLTCCNLQGCKELDMTKRLNWIELCWPLVRYTIWKYFLQFDRFSVHFVDGFICYAEVVGFYVSHFLIFAFVALALVSDTKNIIAKTSIKVITTHVFFRSF